MSSLYASAPRLDLPQLPDFIQLTDRVWRVLGLNPGKFTLQGTNTYLVGKSQRKILIDCGDGQPDYVPHLIASLQSIHPEAYISDIFISHCHKDHWGGLPSLLDSEINQQTVNIHKYPLPSSYDGSKLEGLPDHVVVSELKDNQVFKVDDDTHIRVVYTPGHAKDHCAFYLEEENTVFTGDCILGHGTVTFEDLTEYMKGLQRVKELSPDRLFPGHGPVVENAEEKIDEYFAIRMAKEKQILGIFLRDTSVLWTPIEMVELMSLEGSKKEYTEATLAAVVRATGLHFIKLYYDGKAELFNADRVREKLAMDPYDAENVISIVNKKWRYIGDNISKL